MPKQKAASAARKTRSPKKKRRAKRRADPPAKSSGPARPAIIPSQSLHHCTPPVVAEGIIYPVLGDPVDLDPCSNPDSIIRARRAVMRPEDGLSFPWRGKVFVNPPYGDKEISPFIEKIVSDSRHNGAEIIALIPANVSAEWFDLVAATARAAFLWGPGEGGRRLKFGGNEHHATFASVVAYWGPNLPLFVRHAIRFCHPWFPEYDLRLTRAILGDAGGAAQEGIGDIAIADQLLALNRHDDLASALIALGSATVGDVMDWGRSAILHRLRALPTYELAAALVCSTRPGVHWLDRRLPRTPSPSHPAQLGLPEPEPGRLADESVDEAVVRHLRRAGAPGLAARELTDRLGASPGEIQGALRRLRRAEIVIKKGNNKKAAYVAQAGEESNAATR